MSEIEKMMQNAGIEPIAEYCKHQCNNEFDDDACIGCKHIEKVEYPPFTAEKQIEIIKVISTNHISGNYDYKYLGVDRDEIEKEIYLNLCIGGEKYHAHDKDFGIALVKLVNLIWQDLTAE